MDKPTISLSEALQLYKLLKNHLPDEFLTNPLEFVGTIVGSMIEHGEHRNFIDALVIMTGYTNDEIVLMDKEDAIQLFIEGFVKHDVWTLKDFCKTLEGK